MTTSRRSKRRRQSDSAVSSWSWPSSPSANMRRRSSQIGDPASKNLTGMVADLPDTRRQRLRGDFYDEAMQQCGDSDSMDCDDSCGSVRSSWLYPVESISLLVPMLGSTTSVVESMPPVDTNDIPTTATVNRLQSSTKYCSSRSSVSESKTPSESTTSSSQANVKEDSDTLKNEIQILSRQLLQVKRRLGPAAERCTEAINAQSASSKTTGRQEFVQARIACNPYESLGEGYRRSRGRCGIRGLNTFFMNRSAIKLANMDAILDFALTNSAAAKDRSGLFRFVDLCGAPGGFSEYLLRRCQMPPDAAPAISCSGYGMSLECANEHGHGLGWKLQDSSSIHNGVWSSYRICRGSDGTGDIFHWRNIECLRQMIAADSSDESAHVQLVVADGGFDLQRDAANQEELTQKLVACETAAALELLEFGGTYIVKMFGFQLPTSRTLVRDLFAMFDRIVAVKPISSRPASAERYLCCMGFRGAPLIPGCSAPLPRSPPLRSNSSTRVRDHKWSGQNWMNRVFMGSSAPILISVGESRRLDHYLDQFDRDMLDLNLKACFSILSYLEFKCMHFSSKAENKDTADDDEVLARYQWFDNKDGSRGRVDIDSYARAWMLHGC